MADRRQPSTPPTPDERRASRAAQRVMEDEQFRAAVDLVERNLIVAWRASKDPKEREYIHARLAALGDVLTELKVTYERGLVLLDDDKATHEGGNEL